MFESYNFFAFRSAAPELQRGPGLISGAQGLVYYTQLKHKLKYCTEIALLTALHELRKLLMLFAEVVY